MYSSNSHFFTSGGSENHIRELSLALVSLGHRVTVFCNSPYTKRKLFISENGVNYKIWPTPKIVNARSFVSEGLFRIIQMMLNTKTIRNIRDSNADIFHQHDFISNYLTTLSLSFMRCPVILTNHLGEYLLLEKYLPHLALRFFLKPYKYIIGPSRELTPETMHSNVTTIYNGFNEYFYKHSPIARETKRRELDLEKNDLFVVVPRRWAPTKGVLYAAKAAKILAEYNSEIKWAFLCCNSPGFDSYKSKISETLDGLSTVKTFESQTSEELARFFNAADVALFPSLLEAVSIASLEAMACGAMILSTRVGGMSEILTNGINSMLIPERDSYAIVKALLKISKNRDTYRLIAQEGRNLVSKKFEWKSVAEQTLLVYKSILR